ncbi:MAG: RagB/SusD family nutrient uptake outer membrane protein [Alistipes sp.]|nr:RagB/SusD family nutrient uptake outer membrane protein [Alistipes sp.]
MKFGYIKTIALAASVATLASCDFLDVAPAKRASLDDAFRDKASTEAWMRGCYSQISARHPVSSSRYEASTDEFVCPDKWSEYDRQVVAYCTLNASNMPDTYFRQVYGMLGNLHMFEHELYKQRPAFLTEEDYKRYDAHIAFMEAYYHFKLLNWFGPCPIMDHHYGTDVTSDQFPGRSHYDYVVDYICQRLDDAYPYLYEGYALDDTYGLGNKAAAKALKSRTLLYAASPLWNGSFPWPNWTNTNYETPGYGKELVSYTFDLQKWYRAKQATIEAIDEATNSVNKRKLMQVEDALAMADRQGVPVLPEDGGNYLPVTDTADYQQYKDIAEHIMLMRYVAASDETMGNKELIFTCFDSNESVRGGKPRNIVQDNNGNWVGGWSGVSPTLQMVEMFYTINGKRPAEDPKFTPESQWLKSAGLEGRPEIINLNCNREPRFYAWISFDGCDLGPLLSDGKPFRVNLRASKNEEGSGYNTSTARDLNQTGYLTDKFFAPHTRFTKNSQPFGGTGYSFPAPLIRLAELYLNLAECCAEIYMNTGDEAELTMALDNLNIIRRRAGVPEVKKEDCTGDKTIRDWVRNERTIELFMEGHRYYDLRRWVECDKYLAAGVRTGLDAFVSKRIDPTIEEFNQEVVVDGSYTWMDRMYLLPIRNQELYSNPQMVQAPGY